MLKSTRSISRGRRSCLDLMTTGSLVKQTPYSATARRSNGYVALRPLESVNVRPNSTDSAAMLAVVANTPLICCRHYQTGQARCKHGPKINVQRGCLKPDGDCFGEMFRCSKREGAHVRRIACDAIIRLGFRQTGDAFRRGCRRFGIGGPGCGPFCRGSRRRASGVRARATKEILRTSESSPQEARPCADRRNDRFPPCPENRRKELRRGTRTAPPRASAIAIPARRHRTPQSPWESTPAIPSNTAA